MDKIKVMGGNKQSIRWILKVIYPSYTLIRQFLLILIIINITSASESVAQIENGMQCTTCLSNNGDVCRSMYTDS
jgi:hypothetical protein